MRRFAFVLTIFAGLYATASAAPENEQVTFRFFLGDIFKMYGQGWPSERGSFAEYCEVFAKAEAKKRGGGEVWQGMVSECLGYAQLSDDNGYPLAACAYFIEASAHYNKAKPEPYESEALERSREEMAQQIAGLGC
jgi:hypothetical protein